MINYITPNGNWDPWYDDRRDYNTNAPSYYDYLANSNKLLHDFVENTTLRDNTQDVQIANNANSITEIINVNTNQEENIGLLQDDVSQLKIDVTRQIDLEPAMTVANLSSSVNMYRMGRRAIKHNTNTIIESTDKKQLWPQSIAYTTNGCIISASYDVSKQTNNVHLVEYDPTDFKIIREKTLELYHANGMAYDDTNNKLLVAPLIDKDNIYHNEIIRINYDTLTIEDSLLIRDVDEVLGVGYDSVSKKSYVWCIKDDKYLIKELHGDTTTDVFTFNKSNYETRQTLAVNNDLFVFSFTKPNNLLLFDKFKGFISARTIENVNDGHVVGELEGISFDSKGNLIAQSVSEYVQSNYRFENIWRIKYYNSEGSVKPLKLNNSSMSCYIDSNATGFNPDGTVENPYKYIEEALNDVTSQPSEFKDVVIKNGVYDEGIWITGNVNIICNSSKIQHITLSNATCVIDNAIITNEGLKNIGLHLWYSDLTTNNLNILNTRNNAPIVSDYSILTLSGDFTCQPNATDDYHIYNKSPKRVNYNIGSLNVINIKNTYASSNGTKCSYFLNSIKNIGDSVTLNVGLTNDLNRKYPNNFTITWYVDGMAYLYNSTTFTTETGTDTVFINGKTYEITTHYYKNGEIKYSYVKFKIANGTFTIIESIGDNKIALQRYIVQ